MHVLGRALLKGAGVYPSGLHQTSPWKEGVRCFFPCFSLRKMLILFPLFTSCLSRTQDMGPSSLFTPCLQQSSSSTDLSVPYVDVSQILLSSLATMVCSLHPTSPCGCLGAVPLPVPMQALPCPFLVAVRPTSILLVMWADNLGLSTAWATLGVLTPKVNLF